jgi:hypothetical protein
MKTYTEIEKLADEVYPTTDMGKLKSNIGFIKGYNQCQEDMADEKLDEDDIKEMALDFIINTGGLPKSQTVELLVDFISKKEIVKYLKSLNKAFLLSTHSSKTLDKKYTEEDMWSNDGTKDLYSKIENLIIIWNIDGTKTAGTLTRQIMKLLNK